ncbi:hypothetical protein B0H14DRAFT_2581375 [Mycena olivaceomarginata]|nr:hypothetical protein B0H14DRAFT_2581375 [Mycena olivaceomarginata]
MAVWRCIPTVTAEIDAPLLAVMACQTGASISAVTSHDIKFVPGGKPPILSLTKWQVEGPWSQKIESKSTPERKAEVKNNCSRPRGAVNGHIGWMLRFPKVFRFGRKLAESRQTAGPGDIQKGYYCELGWEEETFG